MVQNIKKFQPCVVLRCVILKHQRKCRIMHVACLTGMFIYAPNTIYSSGRFHTFLLICRTSQLKIMVDKNDKIWLIDTYIYKWGHLTGSVSNFLLNRTELQKTKAYFSVTKFYSLSFPQKLSILFPILGSIFVLKPSSQ